MRNSQVELTYRIEIVENLESRYEKELKSNFVTNFYIKPILQFVLTLDTIFYFKPSPTLQPYYYQYLIPS